MKAYLDIVERVLTKGKVKRPIRKNPDGTWEDVVIKEGDQYKAVSTLALPNVFFSHDMCDGFPLITTKRMPWKTLKVELEGFIKGITNKAWYQDRGCKIWDEWCNPQALNRTNAFMQDYWTKEHPDKSTEEIAEIVNAGKKDRQFLECDLGPIYGYQWRQFGEDYGIQDQNSSRFHGVDQGYDQLKDICDKLRENPHDRRMVCSAWNPNQMGQMALPPCHWGWNVTVIGGELNLFWAQRSCDLMLGVPFNIASYGLLLHLLAKHANLKEGNLSGCLVDCHIYENQIEAAKAQLEREPKPLPTVKTAATDIFKWTHEDSMLVDYISHGKLDFGSIAI